MKTFYAHGFRPASGFHGGRLGAPLPAFDFDITLPPIAPSLPFGDLAAAPAPAPAPAPTPVPAPLPVEFNTQPLFPYTYPVYPVTTPALPLAPEATSEYKIPTYVWAGGAALAAALVVALVLAGKKS